MSRYIVVDLEELKKSPYIVIDLSNIGETSPQLTQIRLIREVTRSSNPYIVVDLEELKKSPYIVIDLEDIDKKVPNSIQIKLIREVYNGSALNAIQIKLNRSVENEQSTNINLIRDIDNGYHINSTQINLKRSVLNEQSANINLFREIFVGNVVLEFSFVGVGQFDKPGITLDVQCCCITRKNEIIAKITEEKPLYVENTTLTIKPFVFLLIKPVNTTGISYSDVSGSISYYEYSNLPLFPDRSNKGYKSDD